MVPLPTAGPLSPGGSVKILGSIGFLFVPPASTGDPVGSSLLCSHWPHLFGSAPLFTWAASLQFCYRKIKLKASQILLTVHQKCPVPFSPVLRHFLSHGCSLKSATASSYSLTSSYFSYSFLLLQHSETQLTPRLLLGLFLSWCSLSLSDCKLPRAKDCD